ncbi:alpha-acetolactate decarboxylase [Enterococcus sp. JM4C]|uniref:acetolactate decarboxylase n=1 Tax=Candidatus Enterococcus huntleyi TaxID=1857217 RepID=UPI00137A46C0|nr:acetolactate decarboxylase [Enterococcus sp. JM4C]KAF1297500.1 alpha-acetolactate decarboxylase [Enterococcus sp. JM4C]
MSKTTLYQHGTLGALMAGLMDGTEELANVLKLGDLGIGTLHGLDGELIILGDKGYQGKADGTLVELTGEELVPYAAVTQFEAEETISVEEKLSSTAVKEKLIHLMKSQNIFSAIKISGEFSRMHIRIMPKQEKPYKRLVEVSANQPEFTKENIEGTIVGFYTPELFQGVAAAGFHLHFLDEAQTFGGHILDFDMLKGEIEVSGMDVLAQHFPTADRTFLETEIDYADLAQEIERAEGSK